MLNHWYSKKKEDKTLNLIYHVVSDWLLNNSTNVNDVYYLILLMLLNLMIFNNSYYYAKIDWITEIE